MTRDLEETLAELGPGYREVVDRLTAAYEPRAMLPRATEKKSGTGGSRGRVLGWTVGYLVAASLLVVVGLSVMTSSPASRGNDRGAFAVYTAAYASDAAALSAIIASQRADGGWSNDFLTMQNAAALRNCRDAEGSVAYRRAVRYLRTRGLRPLSDEELRRRGTAAAQAFSAG